MTKLCALTETTHEDILYGTLEAVTPAVLYYVFVGRNAWHSTWVTQYSVGCMHLNVQSAKNHAETRRVQGSVFNIRQIPAIVLWGTGGPVFITQINSKAPFRTYSPEALRTDPPTGQEKIENALDHYLVKGALMRGAVLSFQWNSRFWEQRQPARNSILFFAATPSPNFAEVQPLEKSTELSQEVSFSHGGNYRLGWRKKGISLESSHALAIASSFA